MVLANPGFHFATQCFGELPHLIRLRLRDRARSVVIGDIALLAEDIELRDGRGFCPKREFEGLNDAVVVVRSFRLVSGGRQGGGGKLQGSVIRNVELPVGNERRSLTGIQIPISDGEQVGDFLPARLVLLEPSEFEPIL